MNKELIKALIESVETILKDQEDFHEMMEYKLEAAKGRITGIYETLHKAKKELDK